MTAKQRVVMILEVWRREWKASRKVNKGLGLEHDDGEKLGVDDGLDQTDKEHEK